jgi:hypothetical protein
MLMISTTSKEALPSRSLPVLADTLRILSWFAVRNWYENPGP